MKLASWNVNSIKARLEHVVQFLNTEQVDVLLLQELKSQTASFPTSIIEDLGYNVAVHGQKTYNGVAIISKFPIEDISTSFMGDPDLDQFRYIEAVITATESVFRVASVYVPNGQDLTSPKFSYKLQFLDSLSLHVQTLLRHGEKLVLGGDYNVAPDEIDVHDPTKLEESLCFSRDERASYRKLINLGLVDAYRAMNKFKQEFSWWDYRAGAWQHNQGLRIDHLLLSSEASDILTACHIASQYRALARPSDHAPVIASFQL